MNAQEHEVNSLVKILVNEYTLGELEERLELTPSDLMEGFHAYVEEHEEVVREMLKEDLWL